MRQRLLRLALSTALVGSLVGATAATTMASSGVPGDAEITITINDSHAGGSYDQVFERVYAGTTADGTPVYIYVPEGALVDPAVPSNDPSFDHNTGDAFTPCADKSIDDYTITQDQIDALGDELADQIVEVDEAHFGPMDAAGSDPASDSLVVLAYNVQDESYYDCAVTTYTAGYFAPEYITDAEMNVIVIDTFDWANRTGEEGDFLYEGVIAHELEHLLMNYSDAGELSWVDEGLADLAGYLNGYPAAGSHFTYHQVFHRETSLTRWGGGLENYGASFSFFLYLWEQAGGNGGGDLSQDLEYDGTAGDLLIKRIFEAEADSLEGVQDAIDTFNAESSGPDLRSAEELFKDWVLAVYADDPDSAVFNFEGVEFGADSGGWTIQLANDVFFKNRGTYKGNVSPARWENENRVPEQVALPYGTSYETFRNPGGTFQVSLDGVPQTVIEPHSAPEHWYAGYESQSDNVLNVDSAVSGGQEFDFWTWYFIEEGWDYAFVEAEVSGEWVTVPLFRDGVEVTTDTNPHDNNEEGNGLTGTSGGAYFVDDPTYINLTGTIPDGATDLRFRYSTDAAYLDTGWFVDDVTIGESAATLSSPAGEWFETNGEQTNNFVLQILAPCDLTPGVDSAFETEDGAGFVYRLEGNDIEQGGFNTKCMKSTRDTFVVAISNLPTGDLTTLDAEYLFRLTKTK